MKRPEDIIGYFIFATALTLIAIAVLFFAFIYSEKVHAYKFEGCAMSVNCPQGIRDLYYGQGNLMYYTNYEYGSKDYWRSYCNGMLNTKFECK